MWGGGSERERGRVGVSFIWIRGWGALGCVCGGRERELGHCQLRNLMRERERERGGGERDWGTAI